MPMLKQAARLITCLVMLLTCGAGLHTERDNSDLGELSDSSVEPMSPKNGIVGHEIQLKESAGLVSNPKCPPSAFPNCMHEGSVDQNTCTCKCKFNRVGKNCQTCNKAACTNGGKMSAACTCSCARGFSGLDCSKGSKCLNGSNEKGGACQCANAWEGSTCGLCKLKCQNGGNPIQKLCKCECPKPYLAPMCEKCTDPGCKNSGQWDEASCKCKCDSTLAYTGVDCGKCVNPGCTHGKFKTHQCRCDCQEGWSGTKCNECTLKCTGGKVLDAKSCKCEDAKQVSYNPCITGCAHGTLHKEACTCSCDSGFKGKFCDECINNKCHNGGKLDGETCGCTCHYPWQGESCEECSTKCVNGDLKNNCEGCKCNHVEDGSWSGEFCQICKHSKCLNGGVLDSQTCKCKCIFGYSGPTCKTCELTQSICENKSIFRPNTCDCECKDTVGDWDGRFCQTCTHKGCKNGGVVDDRQCLCVCVPVWEGRYCDTCGHTFCDAKPAPWARDKEGFTSQKNEQCDWVRSDLGCPASVN